MNLLADKSLLRSLLYQGDQLNTLNGGTVNVDINIANDSEGFTIKLRAPGIDPDQLKALAENKSIQVFATLPNVDPVVGAIMPLFYRKINLPAYVNADEVDAIYKDNQLEIFVPAGNTDNGNKHEIRIKQL
jgi:HSP20 family protein